ncbi:hypothetical protein B7494_g8167 [Chlorociboria aeruginascens]|nr:hypothetical protein B7494_g8167 [Chlorociboria aeruginascens]
MVPSFDSAILVGILVSASLPSLINAIPYQSYEAYTNVSTSEDACQSSSGSTVTYTVTVTATRPTSTVTVVAGSYGGSSSTGLSGSGSSIISTTSTYGSSSTTPSNSIVGTGGSSTTIPASTYGSSSTTPSNSIVGTGGSSTTIPASTYGTGSASSSNSVVGTGGSSTSVTPVSSGTIVPTSTGYSSSVGYFSTGTGSTTPGGYGDSTGTSTQGQYSSGSSTSTSTSTEGQYGGGSTTTSTNSNYGVFYTGSGTASGSGTATGTGMKRGLGYNDPGNAVATPSPVTIQNFGGSNSHVSWAYSWGSSMNKNFPSYLEFVPMLWNTSSVHTDSFNSDVEDALSRGSQHILAFNEPDICPHAPDWAGTTQACMDPQPAAEGYVTWIMPYAGRAKLGAPAVTNGDFSPPWLTSFMQDCYTLNCTIDFVPVHVYGGVGDITPYTDYLQKIYNIANNASIMAPGTPERMIWLTEFQANGDVAQQTQFLQDFFQWADRTSWVERYAWFAAIPDMSGSLVDGSGTLTELGQTYATT